ncbi:MULTISPECIES: hypothetical protein [Lactococcus]|uniref:hypothetical protein n=1 Tax=Lactococcus TaxID=1357 RepID=UPI0020BECADA|nr:hypothetical protein [Lactococcus petauri]UQU59991.1 hypothetical protein lgb_00752 [Lactococcus petauri]
MSNQLTKNQRYTLLKLSNEFSDLEEVLERIVNDHHNFWQPLTAVKNIPEEVEHDEKNYLYKWDNFSSIENISFSDRVSMRFIVATASIESGTRLVKNKVTGELLPKRERLNISKVDTIFIESDGEVYCIISTFNFYELKRVEKLIGVDYIDPIPARFQADSDLFQWLFYKYIKNEAELNDEICLDSITGFTGTVISEENKFEGQSEQIADLIIAKAFLTNGYPLTSVRLSLQTYEGYASFYLEKLSNPKELQINVAKLSTIQPMMESVEIEISMPIYIYFYLIPTLVSLYKSSEEEFASQNKNSFLSEIGIEVIKTIMARNDIKINDIK